jgi:hypothetical protein
MRLGAELDLQGLPVGDQPFLQLGLYEEGDAARGQFGVLKHGGPWESGSLLLSARVKGMR